MAPRPFDYSRSATRRFVVPDWFKAYWHPSAESLRHWQWQAGLARRGRPHTLPDDCMKPEGYLFAAPPPPPEPYEGHWHQIPDYQFRYLLEMSHFTVLSMRTAWFSHKRENDNLEIRAIGRKRPAPGAR